MNGRKGANRRFAELTSWEVKKELKRGGATAMRELIQSFWGTRIGSIIWGAGLVKKGLVLQGEALFHREYGCGRG